MKAIKKLLIFLILLTCTFQIVFSQENEFITRLKTQLLLYRTQQIVQTINIQTDKSLYRPGETIWMKGYVVDAFTQGLSLNSLELSVMLSSGKGVIAAEGNYLLKNGIADFSFSIPCDLPCNVYTLIAYTPEMEHIGIQAVFKKEIIIGSPERYDIIPNIVFSKPIFAPEKKETASIKLKDFNGKILSGKKFDYQIINGNRELLAGKGKTDGSGAGEIVFITPSLQNVSPLMISLDIPAGNNRLNIIDKIPISSEKINVTFFPDGGKLVPEINQVIIFEALDQLGNPVNIKANIIDEQGNFLTATSTVIPGMGVITLLNNYYGQVKMHITSDIGEGQEIPLPPLSSGSMSISVKKNDGKNLSLLLGRSPKSVLSKFRIVAVSNGEMTWASDFELEQSGVLNVPLDNFQSEIAAIAVFSDSGALVAQRLVYTGKNQKYLITLTPNKSNYKKGEEGEMKVKVTELDGRPLKTEFAVSLADRNAFSCFPSCFSQFNYGLEKPLPFKESLDKVNRMVLDYCLAMNRLKGFDWNRITAIDPAKTNNIYTDQTRISGKVVDSKDLAVPNALVSLTGISLPQFNTRSDQNGEFVISLPLSIIKKDLAASATDGFGKGNYRVIWNKSFKDELINSMDKITVTNWQVLEQLYQSNYFKNNPDFLKVGSSKIKSGEYETREPYWKRNLNNSTSFLDIIKSIRPFEMMGGKIVFRGRNSINSQDGALIVVDGVRVGTDISALNSFNPQDVEDINIYVDPVEMSRYAAFNSVGVIDIKTKRGKADAAPTGTENDKKASTDSLFKPQAIGNSKYDLKTTLQWVPVLFTDENGEAVVPFKTGNIKSTFVFNIKGFTDQGHWIKSQTEIKVE